MTDQSANDQFHASSFMQGHNAEYLEQMHARYSADPVSVDAQWADFFAAMGDEDRDVHAKASGPSWARSDWPPMPMDDLTSAFTGEYPAAAEARDAGKKISNKAAETGMSLNEEQLKRAVLDGLRALMLIRAYRIRGHLAADLDPLGMREDDPRPELDPASYGFTEADMDRPIFLDTITQ